MSTVAATRSHTIQLVVQYHQLQDRRVPNLEPVGTTPSQRELQPCLSELGAQAIRQCVNLYTLYVCMSKFYKVSRSVPCGCGP